MAGYNLSSGYGLAQASNAPFTTGKIFAVADSTDTNFNNIDQLYRVDPTGLARRYSTITNALAACTTGNGDTIILSPLFTTALTAAELLSAETKGVAIVQAGKNVNGVYFEHRALATLPATAATPYFTVTGRVKLISIIGEVTTLVQTQACNAKLISNPTVGADVDLCAVLDITASAVGAQFSITGTLANAMVKTTSGAGVFQAAPLLIMPGTIDFSTSATNTGATKWRVEYVPVDAGARIFAA